MKRQSPDPRGPEPWGYDPNGFYPKKYEMDEQEFLNKKSVAEELREAGYLPRENDWTQVGPLAPLWKLPYPLNIIVLTPVLTVLLFLALLCLIPRKRR